MNADTLYYLFSTLAQTYAAIVGLIGMLTVYKLQQLRTDPVKAVTLVEDVFKHSVIESELGTIRDPDYVKKFCLNLITNKPSIIPDKSAERLDQMVKSIDKIYDVMNGTKDRFIFFLLSNLLIIFLSLILLPFCESLALNGWKYFWTTILMILVVVSLYATIRLCLLLIDTEWKEFWQRTKNNIKEHKDKYELWLIKNWPF